MKRKMMDMVIAMKMNMDMTKLQFGEVAAY